MGQGVAVVRLGGILHQFVDISGSYYGHQSGTQEGDTFYQAASDVFGVFGCDLHVEAWDYHLLIPEEYGREILSLPSHSIDILDRGQYLHAGLLVPEEENSARIRRSV